MNAVVLLQTGGLWKSIMRKKLFVMEQKEHARNARQVLADTMNLMYALDVRKKYRDDFEKVVSHERANKVFGAEDEFKSLVRREFQKRESEKKQLEYRKKGF